MKQISRLSVFVRQSDPRQVHRLGNILRFFAVLLVLTIIARGTAGATMPTVSVQTPSSGTISKSVHTGGTISYAGGTPFTLPEGLLVTGVLVQEGQSVKAGDPLASFDPEELDRAVVSKQAELQQVQIQAAQQSDEEKADSYNAQLAQEQLERAYEATRKTCADGEESIQRAQQKRDEAAKTVEDTRNAPLDENLPQQEAQAQKQASTEAAVSALKAAEEELYQAKKAAESANDAALAAAQNAEDNRNTALHALEKEEETAEKQNAVNRAAAAVSEANAAKLQAELEALLALQAAGGQYKAPANGTLIQMNLKAGEPSPAVGGLLAAEDAAYTVEVPLTSEQATLVTVGTVFHVSQNKASGDAAVQRLSDADNAGNVTATATLPQGAWSAGAAQVSAMTQSGQQDLVLPVSAVHQDQEGNYVLVMEEKNTILGLQYVLRRVPVSTIDSGDSMQAVSGALDTRTQVVVASSKPVQEGNRVKVDEKS